ncbi:TonB-dependent receptor plug domain-containing protein [Halopseudomonas oceani]|uniref:TonB-dependent receptor n=1 Tax=Halopseudomonas oceani TaxID=1708783 RepID=UPI002AA8E5F8|nr:TonB-dependent receptor plug domain-containing protein [Halopseudomonas oceani]
MPALHHYATQYPPVRKLLLATVIGLAIGSPQWVAAQDSGAASAQTSQSGRFTLNVPAGDMASALNAVGEQTGVVLSFNAGQVASYRSSGLQGEYSVQQALTTLLAGSPLQVIAQSEGVFLIRIPDETAAQSAMLPLLLVQSDSLNPDVKVLQGGELRDGLRSDLAESVSVLPSVRVDNTASSSLRQGDLKPAEFSIRGAAAYQNKIELDGASIDNLLDPATKERADNYTSVAGHSQGLFIDTDFLDRIEVVDVNVSAADGGFAGGIVRAQTRAYAGRDSLTISHRMTKDAWTEFHVDPAQEGEFSDGAVQLPTGVPGELQPNFRKSQTSINGTTRVGDIGIFAGISEKRSRIKQMQLSSMDLDYLSETGRIFRPSEERALESHSRYAVVRMDMLERDYLLNASLAYSDYSEDSFLINFSDSDFESQHHGLNLSVNFARDLGPRRMELNLRGAITADHREYGENVMHQYDNTAFYGGGSFVGGYGELENSQRTLGSTLRFTQPLGASMTWQYGGEFNWIGYRQDRANNFTFNRYRLDFSQPLPPQESPGSWSPTDQYLYRNLVYQAGELNFSNLNAALFSELTGEYGQFGWRTGLRAERDGWLGNTNFAPRLLLEYFLDESHEYRISAGANRYYGKSFLSYRLREKERSMVTILERNDPNEELSAVAVDQRWSYTDLKTPYDDEYSLGISGPLGAGHAGLQFVHRRGREQVRTFFNSDTDVYRFTNGGSSETNQVDLIWQSNPLNWRNARWSLLTTASWMDKSTDSTYIDGAGGYLASSRGETDVIFEGRRIKRNELPGGDMATPVTANIDLITQAFGDRLYVRNSLTYTDGYESVRDLGLDAATGLDKYEVDTQSSTLSWDVSMEYQLLKGDSSPYVRVDVANLTNNSNVTRSEEGVQLFAVGRQYWLELGYRF